MHINYRKMLIILFLLAVVASVAAFSFIQVQNSQILTRPMQSTSPATQPFWQFSARSLEGEMLDFQQFKGKKIIVLNTASECGYTPQYADWQKFYDENKASVVVLGFPCNQFGGQEPGAAAEIGAFCQKNYGVTFPVFEKIEVKGPGQSPIYHWLSDPTLNGWNNQVPTWNFCKYVVDENGQLTHFFASKVTPSSEEFLQAMGL
jgi:glutathione peroxidase